MATQTNPGHCPDERMKSLLAAMKGKGDADLNDALRAYPDDPRLHFLKGSMLAGRQDYAGARAEMRRALELAPGYAIARFQLGLLLLTCGEAVPAQEVLGPLQSLPPDNFLRLFASGLHSLIRDDFTDAANLLRQGMARNQEIPAMNRDMQLIIDELRGKLDEGIGGKPASSVDMLLQQAALKASKH
jgi:tetratricopeptide (TPR) repeat protein